MPRLPADHVVSALLSADWKQRFRRRLRRWYRRHARQLPWRETRDPYAIWVSEIMLQQTQVETVKRYYDRFLRAFPTIEALATADEEGVLRLWEGLGYYRRARALHTAAQQIVEELDGSLPRDSAALAQLPGIGRYTAGAILSFAHDLPRPILEANTIRLWCRLLGERRDPTKSSVQARLWQAAEEILPRRAAGEMNQALMELGSLVCTAAAPDCPSCPVTDHCTAFREGRQASIPRRQQRQAIESIREAAVVVRHRGRLLIRRCQPHERWAGLWDFPRFPLRDAKHATRRELVTNVLAQTGVRVEIGKRLTTLQHGVTRYRITLECHLATHVAAEQVADRRGQQKWVRQAELASIPLSTTGRKIADLLATH